MLYNQSFVHDLNEFATAILEDKRGLRFYPLGGETLTAALSLSPNDALEASRIATALQYSFRKGIPVFFDEMGDPIMDS